MLRDLLSSRAIQAGFVFFVVVAIGSLLYSQHVHRTSEVELARTNGAGQSVENKTRPAQVVNPPKESDGFIESLKDTQITHNEIVKEKDIDIISTDISEHHDDIANIFPDVEVDSQNEILHKIDFKTTPEGFPLKPYWEYSVDQQAEWSYDHKLIDHVLVKLWRQGIHNIEGGSIGDNGRVHPHYSDTLYVEWGKRRHPDGTMKDVITSYFGSSGIWKLTPDRPFDLPPLSVRLIDIDSSEGRGIDPYTFLTSTELP